MTGTNQIVTLNNMKEDGTLQTRIHKLPPILFIQLKRFTYSPVAQSVQKLNSFFSFPLELDMRPFTDSDLPNSVYCLQSIFIHGGTLSAGHYYSYVCTRREGATPIQWCMVNDVAVEEVSLQEVLDRSYGKKEETVIKKSRKEAEKDDLYIHYPSDHEEIPLSGKSRLRLDGGRDEFTLDARTTSAYVLVYVQKHSLETEPIPITRNSDSFIHQLLLTDMKARIHDYFLSQAIQLNIYSLSLLNTATHNTQIVWKEQPLKERRLQDCGQAMGIPFRHQDWWLMERHSTTGRLRVTRRVVKREIRDSSIEMVEKYGSQQGGHAILTLYCRSFKSPDFTTGKLHNPGEEYVVFLQQDNRGKRQWQDVLVHQDLRLHVFLSHIAQLVRSVVI